MELTNQLILLAGILFLTSILASVVTPRLGVPLLFVFLIIGMLAGEDGPGGIKFGDYQLANLAGTAALAVVLFDGGMRTHMGSFRVALRPALTLATFGTLLTAAIAGSFSTWLLGLSWAEGALIGAIVASTDAAAVFSLLHTNAVSLNQRVTSALEIESGTNDPMAVFLTLALLGYLTAPQDYTWTDSALFFMQQMGVGAALGWGGGYLLVQALNRLELSDSLYPLLTLFTGLAIFGVTAILGGSGFLAVYLAGLFVGNRKVRAYASIRRFHDGIAWMSQIGMFVILGLLVTPTKLVPVAVPGLLISLVLIVVARPVAVWFSLLPFRFPWREQVYISWVGLRGSVPILLATYPWIVGLENAGLFFNIAFFIVLVSLVIQGWTVAPAARLLGLQLPQATAQVQRVDLDLPGQRGYEVVSYRLEPSSALIGMKPKDLPVADTSRVICVSRHGHVLRYRDWGTLRAGDYVSLLVEQEELPELDELFQSTKRPQKPEEQRFFGEFMLNPTATVEALHDAYGIELPESAAGKTLAQFLAEVLPRPVVGDRLKLGEMELIVKEMDGEKPSQIGLRLPH
jgi:cell volume regulation protein A